MDLNRPLRPRPVPSLRPWAGKRLGGGVGEMWIAGPGSLVTGEDGASVSLDALAGSAREALVGTAGMEALGPRFPLLAKLIDAAEWLSLQVHPDDALARQLCGADAVGKDEIWVVLDADASTRLVAGPATLHDADLLASIAGGTVGLDACHLHAPAIGDVLNVRAGTVHAIGPGAFVYELEQPSDLTFRISDWGRPATPGRRLHPVEAGQAVVASQRASIIGTDWRLDGGALNDRHLRLELVTRGTDQRSPAGRSPEVVTALRGGATLRGDGWEERLQIHETIVIPAAVPGYELVPGASAVVAVGSLPV